MSGCFGNDIEDRARAFELDQYLDSLDSGVIDSEECEVCGDICELGETLCGHCMEEEE